MPHLVAACAVHTLHPDAGSVGVTAIDKRPLEGAVRVGKLGVRADVQASRKHHGGPDKAVYAYANEDAAFWEGELDRDLFGRPEEGMAFSRDAPMRRGPPRFADAAVEIGAAREAITLTMRYF